VRARYCDRCGALLAAPPPTVCEACGAEHWRNAKPCANALVLRGDQVLLVRRAHAPWRGAWCAPGGFCDPNEHPIAAAEREILEEAGIRARVTGVLGVWLDVYADDASDPEAETISVAYYFAEPVDDAAPEPFDPAETAEVRWFPLDEPPKSLAPPGTLEQILDAARAAVAEGRTHSPLPDRP
jgi:ADP-ribose pyrophosphatase YjhB (NUDIX family)